ncbi:GAF domain-containing protein [Deinococcus detaillensis]|uniref:histidine kinase n=1 Tax=Deinococcus detaillensis TaxID=2592048 RepID=A0A553UPG7_9DEIO|nr:ATP-binding protein [Deinococcus detaillensis]TSA82075.1 GAF domain-containing protein [Deinococcus detaillensis]
MNDTETPFNAAADQAAQLITHLQGVTQALAAVRQQGEVFGIILNDALEALQGIAGTVLLVQGNRLYVAARRGHDDASVWQDSVLSDSRPGPDVLRSNTPLFFSGSGDLVSAYPQLEVHSGGVAAVASAVLPMVEDGQPLGVIVLDFREPHDFTTDEERFLLTLAGQCALALDRVRLSGNLERQVQDRTAELEAFVRFTELADGETDVLALAGHAEEVLSLLFPGCTNGYYALEDGAWKLKVYSRDLEADPDLLASLKAGLPLDTPVFAQSARTGGPVFVEGWNPEKEQIAQTEAYQSVGTYPLSVGGSIQAVFVLGRRDTPHWTAHQQAVFHSVGRSLKLALERTEQTRQLKMQRDMLQASNEELEAFTYSVSHDLRTPVRHIIAFGGLLRRSLPGPLSEKAERYFGVVEAAAVHLNQLIDGILEISRTSRQPLRVGKVDLGRLVEMVHKELSAAAPDREISWKVAELPTVTGDADLLRRVVMALLSNAVKYTRTREQAVIEIWAEEQPQSWTVLVRDNGIGFGPQYQGKLFTMFQRLHPQEEYEGAGVDLANARRIVTRHGGTVMAQGRPGVGATFGFTLPKAAVQREKAAL